MGVHGLWGLLAPVGRRVSVETLAGKRLAVDASIWMVQFMRAMRDDKGDMIRDAHILGFLRRICKLLFLRARPVFVFDGATPALKRRTLAARRRHRDAAQAKVRKTAEKLLISHLKASRLEELAAQIKSDRAKHDAKGKQVESSRREETEITNGDQNQNDDGENSRGTTAPINQEKLDELLAASLAAEDEADLTGRGEHNSASVTLQEGTGIDEDENDDDVEMIFPMTTGELDPAVLASLPPSMQLDLLVQMRERVMAENRQKYQKIKKEPAKFSELQIQSYLKTVAFRREIEEVQRGAAGKDVGGIQTSKIASEANREFIFSSSFTGDKQTLAQRGVEEHTIDSVKTKRGIGSTVFKSSPSSSSRSINPHSSEPLTDFGPDVETYCDERGRMRVSRVRAMGIRMTRDIQRNLDFIKEHEQTKVMGHTSVGKGSTSNEEPPDFPEHLFKNDRLQSTTGLSEDFAETIGVNEHTPSLVGGSDEISESSYHGSKETIEISFVNDQIGAKDNDDELFLHLVSGTSSNLFAAADHLAKNTEESDNSEGIWEGVIEEETLPMKVDEKGHQSSQHDNCSADDELEWEEGGCDVPEVPSSSEYSQFKLPKGDIEEEALIQEAIKRSLEDSEKQKFENGVPEDLRISVEDKSLQSHGDVSEPSEAPGITYSCSEASFCKEIMKEMGVESNAGEDGVMHDPEVLDADGQENKNQAQREINDGQTGTNRAYSLGSLPLHNLFTSTPAARPSPSSKDNDTILSAPKTHEWPKDDSVEVVKQNTSNSDKSECNTNDPYIGETSKAPQKELLMDELVAKTAIQKENVIQEDINITTSEMNSTEPSENYDSHIISENNLDEELSFLRREQVDLGNERRKLESHAESVSSEMFAECRELLQMFGLPYIIAPMEAEAQCAYMEINNLVDGVVTDDSDVFLFGARNVYKNIFDERKYVETYLMKDIESELGLTREQLIRMALLLGSDYTEGISGIGIVNAIEVVNAFPEEDGLQKFREWIESPDPAILGLGKLDMEASGSSKRRKPGGNEPCEKGNSQQPECVEGPDDNLSSYEKQHVKEVFMSKHRNVSKNWHIPSTFPSETVISAYISPQVDDSTERFSWGRPDLSLLRKLCWERFGWNKEKADELLLPVLKEYNKHETQLRMEAFYSFNERFAKIRSKRVQKAIKGITGKTFSETDELQEDSPSTSSAPKKKEAGPSKPRGKRNTSAGPRHIGGREDDKIGDPNSFADADELAKEHRNASKKKSAIPSGRSRGRGRKGMNVGQETARNQEDSEVKGSTVSLDEGSHKRHTSKSEGMEVRRSNRKRKQVTYMEDDHEAHDNDVPLHQVDDNDPSQTASDSDMTGRDTQFDLPHRDTSELNSDQMHEDPGNAEDMDEDPLGFELREDQTESAPKEYLFTGGGFCMEEDEQDTAVDRSGGDGTSDACEDMGGVSEGRKSIGSSTTIEEFTENASKEARGASSSKRRKADRGLPKPIKRRRN